MASKFISRLRRKDKEAFSCLAGTKDAASTPYGYVSYDVIDRTTSSDYLSSSSVDNSGEERRSQTFTVRVTTSNRKTFSCDTTVKHIHQSARATGYTKAGTSTTRLSINKTIQARPRTNYDDPRVVPRSVSENDVRASTGNTALREAGRKRHDSETARLKRRPFNQLTLDARLSDVFPRQREARMTKVSSLDTLVTRETSSHVRADVRRPEMTARRVIFDQSPTTCNSSNSVTTAVPKQRPNMRTSTPLRRPYLRPAASVSDDSGVYAIDGGVSVDESMTEFLSNVDQNNLRAFLNFYDKVTANAPVCSARELGTLKTDSFIYVR